MSQFCGQLCGTNTPYSSSILPPTLQLYRTATFSSHTTVNPIQLLLHLPSYHHYTVPPKTHSKHDEKNCNSSYPLKNHHKHITTKRNTQRQQHKNKTNNKTTLLLPIPLRPSLAIKRPSTFGTQSLSSKALVLP